MADVVLPTNDHDAVIALQLALDETHNVYIVHGKYTCPTSSSSPSTGGEVVCFVRLSAQIYNSFEDYERLSSLVLELLLDKKKEAKK